MITKAEIIESENKALNKQLSVMQEDMKDVIRQRDVLFRELHHRVKNNLQVISSILDFQARYFSDEKIKYEFKQSCDRIRSISHIYEQLYKSSKLTDINMQEYLSQLSLSLAKHYDIHVKEINIKAESVLMNIDKAILCGLITNELLTNAIKHTFNDQRDGNIEVRIVKENNNYKLSIKDIGDGIPDSIDINSPKSVGLQICSMISRQLKGTLDYTNSCGS